MESDEDEPNSKKLGWEYYLTNWRDLIWQTSKKLFGLTLKIRT